ncbi:hypothetical protein DM02DRAFT_676059 [Periconia macrospinosa]|uniref:Uncharacterized protein n=1 Tax=Periconia macrospinosa TaxID=97972 RepID=A0A2V1D962_9PLEO|nr:hypothetical protein DM02DRAFT_676059 [Periconia macrospinosa]
MEELEEHYHDILKTYDDNRKARSKALGALFVTTKRAAECFDWYDDKRQSEQSAREPAIPTDDEFFSAIKNTNFSRFDEIALLTEFLALPYAPYVPVGIIDGIQYRLNPTPHTLRNDISTSYSIPKGYQLLPEVFLGVNFEMGNATAVDLSDQDGYNSDKENMPPRQPHNFDSILPITPPLTPLHNGATINGGFVFYQLGNLEFYPSNDSNPNPEDLVSRDWIDTNFVIVIKLLSDGTQNGVYIMYNDNVICDCGERHNEGRPKAGGFLSSKSDYVSDDDSDDDSDGDEVEQEVNLPIFCAAIAARFEDLAHGKELHVNPLIAQTTEFSRVMRTPDGKFIAQGN